MKPVVDRLKDKYDDGAASVTVVNLSQGDADDEALAQRFNVQYVPTFVFVDAQGTQVGDMIVGEATEDALASRIDALQ